MACFMTKAIPTEKMRNHDATFLSYVIIGLVIYTHGVDAHINTHCYTLREKTKCWLRLGLNI